MKLYIPWPVWVTHNMKKRFPQGTLALTLLFLLIEFFDEFHYGVESAALPALRDALNLDYTQIGLLLGLPGVLNTFIEPVLMLLGDTPLRKWLVLGGGLTIAAGTLLVASGPSFPVLLLAFCVLYPASGAFVTLSQATLMDLHPGRRAPMMARWTVFGSAGNLLGPLAVAGMFALGGGWQSAYLLVALLALGLALPAALARFPQPHTEGAPVAFSLTAHLKPVLAGLAEAARDLRLMRWFVLLDFSDLLLDVYVSYVALYYADVMGLSPAQVSLMLALLMAVGLANTLLLVPLLERFPGRRLVRITSAAAAVLYAAFLLAPWPGVKLALSLGVRFAGLGWYEVLQAEAYGALPGRSGVVMALSSLMGLLGGAMVWFVGWFAGQSGLQAAMWLLLAGPLVVLAGLPRGER